ncbi:hypothetical protein D3C77_790550 [compost metagenome]
MLLTLRPEVDWLAAALATATRPPDTAIARLFFCWLKSPVVTLMPMLPEPLLPALLSDVLLVLEWFLAVLPVLL